MSAVVIIDYGSGNLRSAAKAFERRVAERGLDLGITVSADPQIQYEHLVAAMDSVRKDAKQELFPNVLVSVGIR